MDAEKQITLEAYEAFLARPENAERRFELIDGEIVEKMTTEEHSVIAGNIVTFLNLWLWEHPLGIAGVEGRHRASETPEYDLLPDVSFRLHRDMPIVRSGAVPFMPDLAVEVKSPDDRLARMRRKADYYLEQGTQIVWLVLPEQRVVHVYTQDATLVLGESDTLSGDPVLPGFTLPVRDIFRGIE
jgi:Uma2 family endonuclease